MPKQVKVRYHWGVDPDIHIVHVECGVEALEILQKAHRKIPNIILLAWRFRENYMTAIETVAALKADAILKLVLWRRRGVQGTAGMVRYAIRNRIIEA